jgi:hypothetical protein
MSHHCQSKISVHQLRRDYTETMATETLMKIRDDLMAMPQSNYASNYEAKRLKRINQVLKQRKII